MVYNKLKDAGYEVEKQEFTVSDLIFDNNCSHVILLLGGHL